MNRRSEGILAIAALAVLLLAVLPALTAQSQDKAEAALKAAMDKEVVDGNLKAAIEQYKKLAEGANKPVAARALVRLGECYEKQGSADARKTYEQVLSRFGDQKEAVEQARARLAALGVSPASGSGPVLRVAWAGPNVKLGGNVSADGRYLPYIDGNTVVVHDFATNTDRRIISDGVLPDQVVEWPRISRDGKQVAYTWETSGGAPSELRAVSLETPGVPQPRRLASATRWPNAWDWSPDGKWVSATLDQGDVGQLCLISTQDGASRVLKKVDKGLGAGNAFFSPDGKYVGFNLGNETSRGVYVVAIDGGAETQVVSNSGQNSMAGWSPDGKQLLFASGGDLWALPVADGKPQAAPELIQRGLAGASMGVTASGALYLASANSSTEIRVAPVDLGTGKRLPQPISPFRASADEYDSQPAWSPDGKYLAYSSFRPNLGTQVLAIRTMETGQVHELRPKSLGVCNWPNWAPDGRSLVCVTEAGLFRIDIQTEEVTPIASSPAGFTLGLPQFSPDGKKVYYLKLADSAARANDGAIIERDLAAGSEREVFRGNSRGAMLSPDGRYFAKGGDAGSAANTKSMVLIPVSGGGPREVFRVATGGDLGKGWTPDSQGLIVWRTNGEAGSQPEAWLYGINGGEPRKLDIDASGVNVNGPNPIRVHPDGRQIAYVASKRANGVWVLENFLPTAKAAPAAK